MDRISCVFAKGQGFVLDSSGYDIEDGMLAGSALGWSSSIDGDDFIDGKAGNDLIYAGFGEDMVVGRTGDDTIYGGPGNDFILGHRGDDTIYGGLSNDRLY